MKSKYHIYMNICLDNVRSWIFLYFNVKDVIYLFIYLFILCFSLLHLSGNIVLFVYFLAVLVLLSLKCSTSISQRLNVICDCKIIPPHSAQTQ